MTDFNLIPLLPEIYMALAAIGLLLVGVMRQNTATASVVQGGAVMSCIIAAMVLIIFSWGDAFALNGMIRLDGFACILKLVLLLGLALSLMLSADYLREENISRFEYPVLMMFAVVGMMLMVSAHNFLSLYMALELQSLSLYVLAAFHTHSKSSAEAGVKYFTLGALSSGMLLFGISLVYGYTGALDYGAVTANLAGVSPIPVGLLIGMVFVLAGISFKISAAPFHMWTPDVYQGAPTSVTAFFAMVPKMAALGLLLRLLYGPFAFMAKDWQDILYFLAVCSMLVGAFAALAQNNVKRLMAYSSIGNVGYALIGAIAGTSFGAGALLLYMLVYMMTSAGVFAVLLSLRRNGQPADGIADLAGLSKTRPVSAYALAILMFSMSGIPPMAGFFAKLVVFQAAVSSGFYTLAVIGVLSSVVAAYYYLRIVKVMFFDETVNPLDPAPSVLRNIVLGFSIVFVLGFILRPSFFVALTQVAAGSLFAG